jgi:hypothetical protein
MTPPETVTIEEMERRATDGAYHFAMKALALIGAVATTITLPLIGLIYSQMDRRVNAMEARQEAADSRFYAHQADQNLIISKERMAKLEAALDTIQADIAEVKVAMAAQGLKGAARENQYVTRERDYKAKGGQ